MRDRRGLRRRRRRPDRARRPVLGPARRRPGDPRRRPRARWPAGATLHGVLERRRARSPSASRSCSCATPTRSSRAASSASRDELAERGVSGLIVPDLPLEESAAVLAACDARRRRARAAGRADDAGRPDGGDRRPRAWLRLHRLGHRDDRRALGAGRRRGRRRRAGARRAARCPSRSASASPTPEQAAAAADAGADGVIVGPALVRAAARPPRPTDPAAARGASW